MKYFINSNFFEFYPEEVKIEYLNDCIMKSFELLPHAFFNESTFQKVYYSSECVKIAIEEWLPFHQRLIDMFSGNEILIDLFQRNMEKYLCEYEVAIKRLCEEYYNSKEVEAITLAKAFKLYQIVNGFAILNFIMPSQLIRNFFKENEIMWESIMCSLIMPHRFQYEKKELELATIKSEVEFRKGVEDYLKNEYIYTKEFEWNLYSPYIDSDEFIMRKINNIKKNFSQNEIANEIRFINERRKRTLDNVNEILRKLFKCRDFTNKDKKLFNLTTLMINISTQEEWRHISTCQFMHILGMIGFEKGIDMTRMSTEKIIKYMVI